MGVYWFEVRTYVIDFLHDFHLIFHFLVEHTVFHEASFVDFFGRIGFAVKLGCYFVYCGKGTFSNLAHTVVMLRAIPLLGENVCGFL